MKPVQRAQNTVHGYSSQLCTFGTRCTLGNWNGTQYSIHPVLLCRHFSTVLQQLVKSIQRRRCPTSDLTSVPLPFQPPPLAAFVTSHASEQSIIPPQPAREPSESIPPNDVAESGRYHRLTPRCQPLPPRIPGSFLHESASPSFILICSSVLLPPDLFFGSPAVSSCPSALHWSAT